MATEQALLTYTNSRGLAEKIRLMLCVAEIQFQNHLLKERSQFLAFIGRGSSIFAQIPVLEYNGLELVQSDAIMRYLAAKTSMYGRNPEEQCRINMLYDGSRDWNNPLTAPGYFGLAEDACVKAQKVLEKYGPIFEKELETNKTGFLVGDSMTLADVGIFEAALNVEDYLGKESLNKYPNIQMFMEKRRADKRIQNYLQNHRFPKLTSEIVKEIKAMHQID